MAWKSAMREAGYDPAIVEDAKKPLVLGNVQRGDLKGAVIGDPVRCCGANCIRREGAEFAWVGAVTAVVVLSKKKAFRYRHNGGIPSMQDRGFFPIGYPVRLVPYGPESRLETTRERTRRVNANGRPTPTRAYGRTIVGEFRR